MSRPRRRSLLVGSSDESLKESVVGKVILRRIQDGSLVCECRVIMNQLSHSISLQHVGSRVCYHGPTRGWLGAVQ